MRNFIIVLISLGCLAAVAECRDRSFKPDLRTPVMKMKAEMEGIRDLILGVLKGVVWKDCFPLLDFASVEALINDPHSFDLAVPLTIEDLKEYMNGSDFEEIHNHLWSEPEWNDLIELLYHSGWNDANAASIYKSIQDLYTSLECSLTLPSGPRTTRTSSVKMHSPRTIRNNVTPWTLFAEETDCTIPKLITGLVESQLFGAAYYIGYLYQEFMTNPSFHLLWATVTEPAKGTAFRETRLLMPVKKLIVYWDTQLKKNAIFQFIFQVLSGLLGIDFGGLNINFVDNVISFIEFLLWGTPFPVPT